MDRFVPSSLATSVLDVYNPSRSVIIDMIMVQFISVILVMMLILFVQGPTMNSSSVSFYLVGLFGCVLMLTGVYTRINV